MPPTPSNSYHRIRALCSSAWLVHISLSFIKCNANVVCVCVCGCVRVCFGGDQRPQRVIIQQIMFTFSCSLENKVKCGLLGKCPVKGLYEIYSCYALVWQLAEVEAAVEARGVGECFGLVRIGIWRSQLSFVVLVFLWSGKMDSGLTDQYSQKIFVNINIRRQRQLGYIGGCCCVLDSGIRFLIEPNTRTNEVFSDEIVDEYRYFINIDFDIWYL